MTTALLLSLSGTKRRISYRARTHFTIIVHLYLSSLVCLWKFVFFNYQFTTLCHFVSLFVPSMGFSISFSFVCTACLYIIEHFSLFSLSSLSGHIIQNFMLQRFFFFIYISLPTYYEIFLKFTHINANTRPPGK